MYNNSKDGVTLYNLKEKADQLAKSDRWEPYEYLDTCMKLQFFPAQFTLCQKLVKRAYTVLKRDNGADFETYRLLYDAGIEFLMKDPKNGDFEVVEFAFKKMKETKYKRKHMRIIFESWCELKKFRCLAKRLP